MHFFGLWEKTNATQGKHANSTQNSTWSDWDWNPGPSWMTMHHPPTSPPKQTCTGSTTGFQLQLLRSGTIGHLRIWWLQQSCCYLSFPRPWLQIVWRWKQQDWVKNHFKKNSWERSQWCGEKATKEKTDRKNVRKDYSNQTKRTIVR